MYDTTDLHLTLAHLGCAGDKDGLPAPHPNTSHICWVETIHILLKTDGVQNAALVNVLGQRQLDEDSVDLFVVIVGLDDLQPKIMSWICVENVNFNLPTKFRDACGILMRNRRLCWPLLSIATTPAVLATHPQQQILVSVLREENTEALDPHVCACLLLGFDISHGVWAVAHHDNRQTRRERVV